MPCNDPLTTYLLDYLSLLESRPSKCRYLFPPVASIFEVGELILFDKHITGRTVFNIVKDVNCDAWPHLFRETAASDIVRADPTLVGVFKVQRRLDLESYDVAFNYLKRFAADRIERPQED